MLKLKSIKDRTIQITLDKGFLQYEIQFSKKACKYLQEIIENEIDNVIFKSLNHIIEWNKSHTYKPKKRITANIIKNVLLDDVTPILIQNKRLR